MQQILTNMWQRFRLSVLFITHDIEESIFLSDKVYVMTARPGRIKTVIDIPLPRPRVAEMLTSNEFLLLKRQLHELIREESFKAMGGDLKEGMGGFGMEVGPQGVAEFL
jgi:NitT/TauT family transport system ATP-binding protein